jgi:glycyl-tRNA synthetase
MAFIVGKKISGKEYYYLVERKRDKETGKVKSRTIAYLGKTMKEAEKKMKERMDEGDISEKHARKAAITIEELANFCKAKGFVFKSSDIYGGFAGFWDFGPLGVEMFGNIKRDWWRHFVREKENVVGMEASIISHPKTWKASGHIANFNVNDYLVVCKNCKKSNKVDKPDLGKIKCDSCGGEYDWGKAKMVEQMFKTNVGIDRQESYLRGETAQGMFMDFKLISQTSRMQLPFGIAQVGRCFRNEIAPRDFLFRSREFHIGEIEFFLNPEDMKCDLLAKEHLDLKLRLLDSETQEKNSESLKEYAIGRMIKEKKLEEWHAYWLAEQIMWLKGLGLDEIKIREHMPSELSHYSSATFDIDYDYSFGSREIAGIANRGQYDLGQHKKESSQDLSVFDEKSGKKVLPKVIEPTFGMERVFLALLTKAFSKNEKGDTVLKLPAKISPIKAAIFPIVKKPEFENLAKGIFKDLKKDFNVIYDSGGSIGRRYARNDEIGTPYCITIDGDSAKGKDATIRLRDTTEQVRVKIKDINEAIRRGIEGEDIRRFGKVVNVKRQQ